MKKIKKTRESNAVLIVNIFSIILLIALPFFLHYDFKSLHNEWKFHLDKGDIYIGEGEWLPTRPIKIVDFLNDTEPPTSSLDCEVRNDPYSGIQINVEGGCNK